MESISRGGRGVSTLALAAWLVLSAEGFAAVVTNLFQGPGSTNIAGNFDFSGDSNSYLEVSGGYQLTNGYVRIGLTSSSKSMLVLVTGTNTVWNGITGSYSEYGFASGANNNTVMVSNGAKWQTQGMVMGRDGANNQLIVTGNGSLLTNAVNVNYVGLNGSGNLLRIQDGGRVMDANGSLVGNSSGANSNWIWVSGTGSLYKSGNEIRIGQSSGAVGNKLVVDSGGAVESRVVRLGGDGTGGSGSSMVISNGGHVSLSTFLVVGSTATSSNNTVLVTGAGSTLSNTGTLYLGLNGGHDNQVTISDGATVWNTSYLAIGQHAAASNNTVLVTGGARLNQSGANLEVGLAGVNGMLVVSNGGQVEIGSTAHLYVGHNAGSSGRVLLTGQGSRISLSPGYYILAGSNTYGAGRGSIMVADGATLSSASSLAMEAGYAGTGTISNNGGVYEFVGQGNPNIVPHDNNAISLNNGWVSFKGVNGAVLNGQITNIAYSGANALRLDNSTNSSLAYYAFTNGGTFSRLELVNGNPLWQSTGLLIGNGGTLLASNAMATVSGALTNAGTISVINGRLTYLNNVVLNGGTFNLQNATNQFNQGLSLASGSSLTVTGGTSRMEGAVSNTAGTTIQALNSVVTWAGPVVVGGRYYSDPSTNIFNSNVTVTASGSLYGSNGDLFAFQKDLTMQSTNRAEFNLANATVLFTNAATHNLDLTGSGALDKGSNWLSITDLATNFAIGTLSIASGNKLIVQGDAVSNALYVGWLDLQGLISTNDLASYLQLGVNVYYDEHVAGNTYLHGLTYDLPGAGLLIPIPEPSALVAVGGGIALLLFLRRRAA